MFRKWTRRNVPDGSQEQEAETVTSDSASNPEGAVRALYVTGPSGGARHILPEKAVCVLGRGAESTIVIDDPRVSRSHAAIQLLEQPLLSDLGSANGTFVGKERLPPNQARPLELGESFLIGDSVLMVRATSLKKSSPRQISSIDQVSERMAGCSSMVVLRVRALNMRQATLLEPVLSELLESPRDWLLRLGADQVLIGTEADSEGDAARLERATLEQLISWGVAGDVDSRFVRTDQPEWSGEEFRGLLRGDASLLLSRGKVVFRDPAMVELKRTVTRVAAAAVNVLILGETGTGKDVIASMLHELSTRSDKAFVGLNCASFPEPLLESELFGHERGAFTGAVSSKPGLFEVAEGGSLFLDEIGDLPLALQAKLLRVIESREITRIGGVRARPLDVRFVAATNKDLEHEIAAGRFRRDLYYRLTGVTLSVPPLRERQVEIEPLARLFLSAACARFGTRPLQFSEAALTALTEYGWPGNVRELRNVVERAVLLASEPVIEANHLGLPSPAVDVAQRQTTRAEDPSDGAAGERDRIARALEQCGGNQSRAAKLLDMPRRTLVRKIAQLGLARPRSKT